MPPTITATASRAKPTMKVRGRISVSRMAYLPQYLKYLYGIGAWITCKRVGRACHSFIGDKLEGVAYRN
jgi:hypothetical protein